MKTILLGVFSLACCLNICYSAPDTTTTTLPFEESITPQKEDSLFFLNMIVNCEVNDPLFSYVTIFNITQLVKNKSQQTTYNGYVYKFPTIDTLKYQKKLQKVLNEKDGATSIEFQNGSYTFSDAEITNLCEKNFIKVSRLTEQEAKDFFISGKILLPPFSNSSKRCFIYPDSLPSWINAESIITMTVGFGIALASGAVGIIKEEAKKISIPESIKVAKAMTKLAEELTTAGIDLKTVEGKAAFVEKVIENHGIIEPIKARIATKIPKLGGSITRFVLNTGTRLGAIATRVAPAGVAISTSIDAFLFTKSILIKKGYVTENDYDISNISLSDLWNYFFPFVTSSVASSIEIVTGRSVGDPHIITLDKYEYDFQTVGEFVLCKSKRSNWFEIQTRQSAGVGNFSINTAVALNVHGDTICIYSESPNGQEKNWLWINHKPHAIEKATDFKLPKGAMVHIESNSVLERGMTGKATDFELSDKEIVHIDNISVLIQGVTGEKIIISTSKQWVKNMLNIAVSVPSYKEPKYEGLLGNANGIKEDDLMTKSGDNLSIQQELVHHISDISNNVILAQAEKLFNKKIARDLSNSWAVTDATSLFDYAEGKSTKDFVNKNFPSEFLSIHSLSGEQLAEAQVTCEKAGVTPENLKGCVFDVAFSKNNAFATSSAMINDAINLANKTNLAKKHIPNLDEIKGKVRNGVMQKIQNMFEKWGTSLKNIFRK